MKIALYIEDGLEQIVLTPDSKAEDAILDKLSDGSRELSIKKGSFYACQGGWIRQSRDDASTIIVLRDLKPAEAYSPFPPSPEVTGRPMTMDEIVKAGL